jgi:septal ring factor EnvC (AmiA/AmiB activator)
MIPKIGHPIARFGTRLATGAGLIAVGCLASSLASTAEPATKVPASQAIADRDQELAAIRAEQLKSAAEETKLRSEIESIGADRAKLNTRLVETAARVRGFETDIAATEKRLEPLGASEAAIRSSLAGRRAVISEVLASLQRLGRNPPPALLVRPEDALRSVRTAIMLGAVIPEMRQEAENLATDLSDLLKLRRDIATEHERLAQDLSAIGSDRKRLALLIEERQKQQSVAEIALRSEREKSAALAQQAGSLRDLIAKLEQQMDKSTRAARAALPGADTNPDLSERKEAERLGPEIAFASAKGLVPMPVNGVKLRDYGVSDTFGGTEKGVSIATRPSAQVTAPCDGRVAYAGPFRSYGQVLILNAGGGYHVVLMGMDKISVASGQFVLTGEPIGVMGGEARVAAAGAMSGISQPVLYVEFRKDGTPIDPSPWWATSEGEKVRG